MPEKKDFDAERRDKELAARAEQEAHAAQQEHAQRVAEFNNHPHTRLNKIIVDLQRPDPDIHGRIGALHRAVAELTVLMLGAVEPPRPLEDPDGEVEQEQRVDAQRSEQQQPARM